MQVLYAFMPAEEKWILQENEIKARVCNVLEVVKMYKWMEGKNVKIIVKTGIEREMERETEWRKQQVEFSL